MLDHGAIKAIIYFHAGDHILAGNYAMPLLDVMKLYRKTVC